jgi:hypothetical protein
MKIIFDPTILNNHGLQILYFRFFRDYPTGGPRTESEKERWQGITQVIRTEYIRRGLWINKW